MNVLVTYKSKTGFTKKYAEWIARELSANIIECVGIKREILSNYEVIIFGGSLHAVGIEGKKLITQNIDILKNKNLIVFAVGASPFRKEIVTEIINKNFSQEEQKYIHFYYLRGGFNYNKLPFFDKILMKLLQLKLKRKKALTPDEKGMLNAYKKPVDFTRKENIKKIITHVRSLKR
ncbi:MAG: flavodoxin domain-containing protein [Atribacterota bacterium]